MTLTEEFENAQQKAAETKTTQFYAYNEGMSLCVYMRPSSYQTFHFLTRTVVIGNGSSDGGVHAIPFAQFDREVLEFMRAKLVDMGGHPPSLPKDDSLPSPIRKNNP